MATTISRRNMLVLAVAGAAAAALPAAFIAIERESGDTTDQLLSMLSDPAGAAEIGRRWAASTKREHNAAALAQKIAKRLRAHGWRPGDDAELMRAALAARVRHEFARDDLVDIEGWQVTRTDAELCMLAALHSGAALSSEG